MKDGQVVFRSNPFKAYVFRRGDDEMVCYPWVVDMGKGVSRYRLAVKCESGRSRDLLLSEDIAPWSGAVENPIATWRASEIVQYLDNINPDDLLTVHYAGYRYLQHSYLEYSVENLVRKIGKENYDRIMKKPVPEIILDLILKDESKHNLLGLHPMVEEIEAGTVKWRSEYILLGVSDPVMMKNQRLSDMLVLERYRYLVLSYARSRGLSERNTLVREIRKNLIKLVKIGANRECSDKEMVALAVILSEFEVLDIAFSLCLRDSDDREVKTREIKEDLIASSAEWLVSRSILKKIFATRERKRKLLSNTKDLLRCRVDKYYRPELIESPV